MGLDSLGAARLNKTTVIWVLSGPDRARSPRPARLRAKAGPRSGDRQFALERHAEVQDHALFEQPPPRAPAHQLRIRSRDRELQAPEFQRLQCRQNRRRALCGGRDRRGRKRRPAIVSVRFLHQRQSGGFGRIAEDRRLRVLAIRQPDQLGGGVCGWVYSGNRHGGNH